MTLLIADGDPGLRSLAAELARERVDGVVVLEAADGAEAIQVGLQRRPQVALLEVALPRLGGIEAAVTLRELRPQMRVALWTAEPREHRDRVRELRLPLFDKLELDGAMDWLARQLAVWPPVTLACSRCGYGVARATPPERCPMCQSGGAWIDREPRAWRLAHELTL